MKHGVWQDTVVAIRKGGNELVVGHLDPSKYATQTFSTDPKQVPLFVHCAAYRYDALQSRWKLLCTKEIHALEKIVSLAVSHRSSAYWPCGLTPLIVLACHFAIAKALFHLLQEVDTGNHTWANYFMCAYKARPFLACIQLFQFSNLTIPAIIAP